MELFLANSLHQTPPLIDAAEKMKL